MKNYLWTSYQYRINLLNTDSRLPLHWLFLPGGPGIGSEYFTDFALSLKLPGITWLVDFPGDGSNRFQHIIPEDVWIQGLVNLTKTLQPCILVTHSFSGMFALSVPEIENYLSAFIIMNSSPNHTWFNQRPEKLKNVNPKIDPIIKKYLENSNDVTFKNLSLANLNLFFTKNERAQGEKILENMEYNVTYYARVQKFFYPTFSYRWFPKKIPTMIIGSDNDLVCPLRFFLEEKDFLRSNIQIHSIANAGHFPWVSEFEKVQSLFDEFIKSFKITLRKP